MLSCLHSHAVLLAALYCQDSDSVLCSVGTERSGSSFSSGITGRLTYADYGGAAWGAPTDAKLGTSFAPAVPSIQPPALTAFGPLGSRQAADGHGISQLWAPESPSTGPTMQSHKQIRHKREVSLSDLGYLGFVARDDHSGECLQRHWLEPKNGMAKTGLGSFAQAVACLEVYCSENGLPACIVYI